MSENDRSENDLTTILENFTKSTATHNQLITKLISDQNNETSKKLDGLITVVEKIAIVQIRSEERHTQYDDRFERLEKAQFAASAQVKNIRLSKNKGYIRLVFDLDKLPHHSVFSTSRNQ